MLYMVECDYTDPQSEKAWNSFYSEQKLPALIAVPGFLTSQRFIRLSGPAAQYLAIHSLTGADVLHSDSYRLNGGGNFGAWQDHIARWSRHVFEGAATMPDVRSEETLRFETDLVTAPSSSSSLVIRCVELDSKPGLCGLSIIPRSAVFEDSESPSVTFYAPLTEQLITAETKG